MSGRFLDKLFGKRPFPAGADDSLNEDAFDSIEPTRRESIQGAPEVLRVVELQRAHWTYNAEEHANLSVWSD